MSMPFVKEGDESNLDVSSLYKEIDDELKMGKIPNILKTTSIGPFLVKYKNLLSLKSIPILV